MRSHPFPYLHIKVGKIALGDVDIVPIDPVGVCEAHAGNAGIAVFDGSAAPYAVRPALVSYGLFTNNVLGRFILSDTLKRCLSNAVAMCPTAEIDFDHHFRLHPYRFPGALLFRRDRFKRSLRCLEGFEFAIKRTGHFMGETCTGAPTARASAVEGTRPATTNSCRSEHLVLIHSCERPELYGALASFETIPSRPILQACRSKVVPDPVKDSLKLKGPRSGKPLSKSARASFRVENGREVRSAPSRYSTSNM